MFSLCSFAGGKRDPSDRNVVDTALREAREELGIAVTENKVWGVLKPLRDAVNVTKQFDLFFKFPSILSYHTTGFPTVLKFSTRQLQY